MHNHALTTNVLAGAVLAFAFTFTAQAQNNRSFVATTGNDTNNCSASSYCRTFGRALAVTNAGGEIVVVNSGGYGPATITQPVVITAAGIDASISATLSNALNINTAGNVTITGLNLNGGGTGTHGIHVEAVGVLRLYNMQIQSFATNCIDFEAAGNLEVYNSKINDCGNGLYQNGGQAFVNKTEFDDHTGAGAVSVSGTMAIANSSSHFNTVGFYANGGTVSLYNDRAIFNSDGIAAGLDGTLYFAHSLISGNSNSHSITSGSTMRGSSPGTSLVTPGQGTIGTLGPAITSK